jgi:hypothetical protein
MGDSDCSKNGSSDCQCALCRVRPPKRKQVYCAECSKEVEACRKDAEENQWLPDFETHRENSDLFLALMRAYQLHCPNKGPGRGKKRERFAVDLFLPTRLRDQTSNSTPRSSAHVSP